MSNKAINTNAIVQNASKATNTTAKNIAAKNTNVKNNSNIQNKINSEKQVRLNSDIEKIVPLLTKLNELQKKYETSSAQEQLTIENEFNTIKEQVIELQGSINKNIENISIDKNIIQLFHTSYPDYFKALTDLYVVNIKAINNANTKNNSSTAPVEKKNTNQSGGKRKTQRKRRTRKY